MLRLFWVLLVTAIFSVSYADDAVQPLPAAKAFEVTARVTEGNEIAIHWQMPASYYLYKNKVTVTATPVNNVAIGPINYPAGEPRHDLLHGNFEAYIGQLTLLVPLLATSGQLNLQINYQGCSSAGFCYTPTKKQLTANVADLRPGQAISLDVAIPPATTASTTDVSYATQLLMGQHYFWMILSFLFLGLLLAFTPCVLPMVPILSSIIVGSGHKLSTRKAFSLSLTYVLGMAGAYAVAGMIVALAGKSVQIALQKPWVIAFFSLLFILLALSLFGLFELRMPRRLQQRLTNRTNKITSGTYAGAFVMGVFSTLIVSPCVSAPLVGVLAYIANSGDVFLGAVALLSLGLGMGIPLLLLGASAGKLLPKAGKWMETVKHIMGFMMLALAVWILSRILPGSAILFLWSLLAIAVALFIRQMQRSNVIWRKLHEGLGLLLLSYGFILMAGAIIGRSDPLYILQKAPATLAAADLQISVVKSMADLEQQLALAKRRHQQVILDFYADWCVACVHMDRAVFTRPEIKAALAKFVLLRADVTQDNAFDEALLQRYHVVAPPTLIFLNAEGVSFRKHEIVGEVDSKQFLADLERFRFDLKFCASQASTC
jgi:thiol:disulfide interchange protein DsbD